MKDRKEYDRLRAARIYKEFQERRVTLFRDKFNDECYLCAKPAKQSFHLHHRNYDSIDSNYPRNSKAMSTRLKRLFEAENNPERFALLCPKCHITLEQVKHTFRNLKLDRLSELLQ